MDNIIVWTLEWWECLNHSAGTSDDARDENIHREQS